MGRASNRKKARRVAAYDTRRIRPVLATEAMWQCKLVAGMQALSEAFHERHAHYAATCRAWCGGTEPVPAMARRWPAGSLGHRLFGGVMLAEARRAPSLLTAGVPSATVITADPVHWHVAVSALVRAVVFDGLELSNPAVNALLEVLAPIARAELNCSKAIQAWLLRDASQRFQAGPEFPILDGPAFLLGEGALVDATCALVGGDELSEALAELSPVVDGIIPGTAGPVAADALTGALAAGYLQRQWIVAEEPDRAEGSQGGNPLEILVAAGEVAPEDVLRTGLIALSVLADLCRSDSPSIIRHAA